MDEPIRSYFVGSWNLGVGEDLASPVLVLTSVNGERFGFQMPHTTAMIVTAAIAGIAFTLGLLAGAAATAPEGYQDERGFHYGPFE